MDNFRQSAWELTMAVMGAYYAIKNMTGIRRIQIFIYFITSMLFGYVAAPALLSVLAHHGFISEESRASIRPFAILIFSAMSLKIFDLLETWLVRYKSAKLPLNGGE